MQTIDTDACVQWHLLDGGHSQGRRCNQRCRMSLLKLVGIILECDPLAPSNVTRVSKGQGKPAAAASDAGAWRCRPWRSASRPECGSPPRVAARGLTTPRRCAHHSMVALSVAWGVVHVVECVGAALGAALGPALATSSNLAAELAFNRRVPCMAARRCAHQARRMHHSTTAQWALLNGIGATKIAALVSRAA
jgi:hypothetical protein